MRPAARARLPILLISCGFIRVSRRSNGDFVWSKGRAMYTLVRILVGRVYSLSWRKDECIERRRRQLQYSSKGSQHKGVAAGLVLTA